MEPVIEVRNLYKTFDEGKSFVLKGLDLKIPKGLITILIGYSGTGKSVLLKHILGLFKPTKGEVIVLGQNLFDMEEEELIRFRTRLGVLFQHAALFDDMTVLENVTFPLREHRRDLSPQEIIEKAIEKLKSSGLDPSHYDKQPSELSSGMQKRVGLARALVLEPAILLYDEPTTGLDPILTGMVDNLIMETHKKHKGSTSVVVTHDLGAAFRIGDYVVMLDKGKVLLEGAPEVFLESDIEVVRHFVEKGLRRSEDV
ncbi:MAG: ATP-binding cassette domain-containing protein [Bdellovibrio sp.]|nr:MAG: ATP-binding cassette domain-containing protein [Bdellovibrio sp.]